GLKAPIDAGNPGSSRRANTTRNQSSLSFVKVMTASASFYGTCGMMDSATFGGRDEIPVWVSGSAEPVRGDARTAGNDVRLQQRVRVRTAVSSSREQVRLLPEHGRVPRMAAFRSG